MATGKGVRPRNADAVSWKEVGCPGMEDPTHGATGQVSTASAPWTLGKRVTGLPRTETPILMPQALCQHFACLFLTSNNPSPGMPTHSVFILQVRKLRLGEAEQLVYGSDRRRLLLGLCTQIQRVKCSAAPGWVRCGLANTGTSRSMHRVLSSEGVAFSYSCPCGWREHGCGEATGYQSSV